MSENKKRSLLDETLERLENGVKEFFTSEKYQEYLKIMNKFSSYSFQNTVLISSQRPDATLVAGYQSWKTNFGRQVKKGEKGIRIVAPMPSKESREIIQRDPGTHEILRDENGDPVKKKMDVTVPRFKVITVFDVSQTEGKELPKLEVNALQGGVRNFADMMEALRRISPVPIGFEAISGQANGYYHNVEKRIAIKEGMSEAQTVKTAIHEVTHAVLHNKERMQQEGTKDSHTKEVEAESVAFTVSQAFGLDTSDYSFPYISTWVQSQDMKTLRASMDIIRHTSSEMIRSLNEQLQMIRLEREGVRYELYQIQDGTPSADLMFYPYSYLEQHGHSVQAQDYSKVYEGTLPPGQGLEDLYAKFNVDRPEDFTGRSLSMSDVVVMYGASVTAYYVDTFGFQEVPDFVSALEQEKPLDLSALASQIDDVLYHYDTYGYNDGIEDREAFVASIEKDLARGHVQGMKEELEYIRADPDHPEISAQAAGLITALDSLTEQMDITPTTKEESISYYVAENMGFPVVGEYRETNSLEEAKQLYEQLPSGKWPGEQGIGAILQTGDGAQRDVPLLKNGSLRTDMLENELFKTSSRLKEAFSSLQEGMRKTTPVKESITKAKGELAL